MIANRINSAVRRVPTWILYVAGAVPPVWLYYLGLTGALGVDPAKAIEHQMGLWALWLLIAGLCVTPLRQFFGVNLLRFRRAIGIVTFFYVLVHLLTWLVLDVQILAQVWADILKRPYITVGMGGFALMLPLVLTSNNWSVRRLGAAAWQKLHKLTYVAAVLGAVHYVMLVRGWQIEPLLYLTAILGLLALRFVAPTRRRTTPRAV